MRAFVFGLLGLLLCGPHPLGGTTLQAYALAELVDRATQVVVAKCESAQPERVQGQVCTRYEFAVQQVLKGQADAGLSLLLPGGQLGNEAVHLAGMPTFSPGDESVLFLTEPDRLGSAWPVGLAQGKFRISRQGPARKVVVHQDLAGISFRRAAEGTAAMKVGALDPVAGMGLDEFLARVRAQVQGQGGPGAAR